MDITIHNVVKITHHLERFSAEATSSGEKFVVLTLEVTDENGKNDSIKLFAANSDLLVFAERP